MTTNQSSGRRHRGRRGRRSGNRGVAQQPNVEQQAQADATPEVAAVLPDLADASVRERPVEVPAPPARPRIDPRPPTARPARRRQPPRQAVGPMPMEVLKRGVQIREPEFELQLRPVGRMVDPTASNFGCPMLNRNQVALPTSGNLRGPRCALGWSIHDQDEALLCIHTAEMADCWKAHPENVEKLVESIRLDASAAAAD